MVKLANAEASGARSIGDVAKDCIAEIETARNTPVWSPPRAHAVQPSADERRMQRYEQVGRITGAMKALSKELSIPVILLAQLSRETEKHEVPRLSHLRESGSIEQDADMVLMIHHPEIDSHKKPNTGMIREADVIVAKHRHGETGLVKLNWQPSATTFGNLNLGREWTG